VSVTVKLEGFAELEAAMEELSKAAGRGVLRRAGLKALKPIAEAAAAKAPRGASGELAAGISVGTKLSKRQKGIHKKTVRDDKSSIEVFAGAAADPAAHNQEFGNENHGPQPFMRPAWDAGKNKVLDDLKTELASEIDKAAKRAARKRARG